MGKTRRRFSRSVDLAVALAVLLAGCGGSDPDDVVADFTQAWADEEYAEACELLDDEAQVAVSTAAVNSAIQSPTFESTDGLEECPAALEELGDDEAEDAVGAEVEDVDDSGEVATVETETGVWELNEQGGDWVIAVGPILPS